MNIQGYAYLRRFLECLIFKCMIIVKIAVVMIAKEVSSAEIFNVMDFVLLILKKARALVVF